MKILADENIPFAAEAFATVGEVVLRAGRAIAREDLHDAEVLLVRSITPVNADLLQGTPVRFVGTATIGVDHVDLDYLQNSGIAFASAIGCNANSVAEYLIAALLHWASHQHIELAGKTLGVVGAGHVGSRVIHKARALGLRVMVNDPPLARKFRAEGNIPPFEFLPLPEILQADFVTLHTPLTCDGSNPTFHLFDAARLRAMKPAAVLINTARGPVVDNDALNQALQEQRLAGAILDVWENEPQPDAELLARTHLATPHVAGYSFDGKVQGTRQIYEALCRFLTILPAWDAAAHLPPPAQPMIRAGNSYSNDLEVLQQIVRQAYDIAADDQALRAGFDRVDWTASERSRHFDQLRRGYPMRREFGNYTVALRENQFHIAPFLREWGFKTCDAL